VLIFLAAVCPQLGFLAALGGGPPLHRWWGEACELADRVALVALGLVINYGLPACTKRVPPPVVAIVVIGVIAGGVAVAGCRGWEIWPTSDLPVLLSDESPLPFDAPRHSSLPTAVAISFWLLLCSRFSQPNVVESLWMKTRIM